MLLLLSVAVSNIHRIKNPVVTPARAGAQRLSSQLRESKKYKSPEYEYVRASHAIIN